MMYPFMTLEDNTEIVHSEILEDGKSVKVYIEKPAHDGFHSAECYLPEYRWQNIEGFTTQEIEEYQSFIGSIAHVIIRLANEGGFDNASNLDMIRI